MVASLPVGLLPRLKDILFLSGQPAKNLLQLIDLQPVALNNERCEHATNQHSFSMGTQRQVNTLAIALRQKRL